MSSRSNGFLVAALFSTTACAGSRSSIAPPPASPPPNSRAALVRAIDSMVNAREFRTAQWGVLIVDPASRDTLYAHNAAKLFKIPIVANAGRLAGFLGR